MKEEYLHHLFKNKVFGSEFITTKGKPLTILDFGVHNVNSGPDFSEAKVQFDDKIWAGPIEFHVSSSDWFKHQHQNDKNYNNVIAHFVLEHDKEVQSGAYNLPTVELKDKIDFGHYDRYLGLTNSSQKIACASQISEVAKNVLTQQKENALLERISRKSNEIIEVINSLNGDRAKAFYLSLAKSFGTKVNQESFLALIQKIDLKWIAKLNYDKFKTEALLLGASGLIPKESNDEYVLKLKKEFDYLKELFNISPMDRVEWKYSKMRPFNFPPIRIAQLAAMLSHNITFLSHINRDITIDEIRKNINIQLNPYWDTHFSFKRTTKIKSIQLTKEFKTLLILNTIVPFIYTIGVLEDDENFKLKALKILLETPSEKNSIISSWKNLGVDSKSAFDSQALIEMKNEFCNRKKCLFCKIGIELLIK